MNSFFSSSSSSFSFVVVVVKDDDILVVLVLMLFLNKLVVVVVVVKQRVVLSSSVSCVCLLFRQKNCFLSLFKEASLEKRKFCLLFHFSLFFCSSLNKRASHPFSFSSHSHLFSSQNQLHLTLYKTL